MHRFLWLLLLDSPFALASFFIPARLQLQPARRQPSPLVQIELMQKDDGSAEAKRNFELCTLNEAGVIEECEILTQDELPGVLSSEEVTKVLNDPDAEARPRDLFFKKGEAQVPALDEPELFTVAEENLLQAENEPELPNDVLLKAFGPDALKLSQPVEANGRSVDSRFHLHFGAGRLGMGLVVPAISASGIPFAVVQRPKPKWAALFSQRGETTAEGELCASVNEQVVAKNVEMIQSSEGTPEFMPPHSIIFGSTPEELSDVVHKATSFSCSLGAAMSDALMPLLSLLPLAELEQQPMLFCCENDHDAVMRLKETLQGRVHVVDCMVDRVCTGRSISSEGVDVSSEPWRGSIVVLEPNLKGRLPFCSAIATAPRSALEAEYLSERKFSLVNGMHTVVAFMTLIDQWVADDGGREYVLLKYTRLERASQRMCEAWRMARAAQLLEKYGLDNIKEWSGSTDDEGAWEVLLGYGDEVLVERFSQTDDVVSRVLGGGVANRWLTRLRPTHEWMQARLETASGALGGTDMLSRFFAYALARDQARALDMGATDAEWRICDGEAVKHEGEGETVIASYLAALTDQSRFFCTQEAAITHKELVKAPEISPKAPMAKAKAKAAKKIPKGASA